MGLGDPGTLLAGDDLRDALEATFSRMEVALPAVGTLYCCLAGLEFLRSIDGGDTAEGVMCVRLTEVVMLSIQEARKSIGRLFVNAIDVAWLVVIVNRQRTTLLETWRM